MPPEPDAISGETSDKAAPPEPPKDPCKEAGAACETARVLPSQPGIPKSPATVTQQILMGLRVSGEPKIQPPREVAKEMRRNGELETNALIKLCLAANGTVSSVTVMKSTKYAAYDQALLAGTRRWGHRPYMVNGTPVPVCGMVQFLYRME
jgi:periplasmic protein TonB